MRSNHPPTLNLDCKALRVIDPHFHLWDLSTGNYPRLCDESAMPKSPSYLIDEYLAEGGTSVEITKAVHIEAIASDPLLETRHAQRVADHSSVPVGLVAFVDLSDPSAEG